MMQNRYVGDTAHPSIDRLWMADDGIDVAHEANAARSHDEVIQTEGGGGGKPKGPGFNGDWPGHPRR